MFTLAYADSFIAELGAHSRTLRKKVQARHEQLRLTPEEGSSVKKLTGYKCLWRLRLGDHRLVYRIDRNPDVVTLLMVGPRGTIYDRLGTTPDAPGPSIAIVTNHPEMIEPEPTAAEIGTAAMVVAERPRPDRGPTVPLPVELTTAQLQEWNVPEQYHRDLEAVTTEAELLGVEGLDQDWHERLLNLVYPTQIEEVIERPAMVVQDQEPDEARDSEEASLHSFLLRLDPDQEALLASFDAGHSPGPWLVKGGPGSGKTVVSLYAIRDILERAKQDGSRPRILFTTYTRALATAAEQLLRHLGIDSEVDGVDVTNVDRMARQISTSKTRVITEDDKGFEDLLQAALRSCILKDRSFPFSTKDAGFLMEEVEWVILGRGITERDRYLEADRSGRTRKLDVTQRRHLWSLHLALRAELENAKRRLFEDVVIDAVAHVDPLYDYVFVDEVHDLKPLALKLCVDLCKDPKHVFMTLDPNQSIYGARREWGESLPRAMAAPRSVVLRKNHRSTAEIWEGTQQILEHLDVHDPETLAAQGDLSGPSPMLISVKKEEEGDRIAAFLHASLIEERASLGCAAILCPTNWDCHSVAKTLPARMRARVMESKDLDLDHNGVKVLTMHAAKGLQFPVVVVARVDKGRFPSKPAPGIDPKDHEQQNRRLLFVACSRAMRRLMVVHTAGKPSPLLAGLDDGAWQVEP